MPCMVRIKLRIEPPAEVLKYILVFDKTPHLLKAKSIRTSYDSCLLKNLNLNSCPCVYEMMTLKTNRGDCVES